MTEEQIQRIRACRVRLACLKPTEAKFILNLAELADSKPRLHLSPARENWLKGIYKNLQELGVIPAEEQSDVA